MASVFIIWYTMCRLSPSLPLSLALYAHLDKNKSHQHSQSDDDNDVGGGGSSSSSCALPDHHIQNPHTQTYIIIKVKLFVRKCGGGRQRQSGEWVNRKRNTRIQPVRSKCLVFRRFLSPSLVVYSRMYPMYQIPAIHLWVELLNICGVIGTLSSFSIFPLRWKDFRMKIWRLKNAFCWLKMASQNPIHSNIFDKFSTMGQNTWSEVGTGSATCDE